MMCTVAGRAASSSEGAPLPKASLPQSLANYRAGKKPEYEDTEHHATPVQCVKCGGWLRAHRFSMSRYVVTVLQVKIGDNPDEGFYEYFCALCWGHAHGNDEAWGVLAIRQAQIKGPNKRSQEFQNNLANIQEEFPMVCVSSSKRHVWLLVKHHRMFCSYFQAIVGARVLYEVV